MARRTNRTHDRFIDDLVERLEISGRYDTIERNIEYAGRRVAGELDVYTTCVVGPWYNVYHHYYEVKSNGTQQNIRHGKSQIRRWMYYMNTTHDVPLYRLKGAVVTPHGVERVSSLVSNDKRFIKRRH